MQVVTDGPASAGKSTVTKIIVKKLGFIYIGTGAIYRACTFIARKENIDYGDEVHISAAISQNKIEFKPENGEQRVYVAGEDVSLAIRTLEITANVSQIGVLKGVREKMVELQREMAGSTSVIMDDRDIDTAVLPDVELKIFLVASVYSRAKRELLDYAEKGIHEDLAKIEHDIAERDYKDPHRAISPLKKADDTVEVDTTNMSIDEVVSDILAKTKAKMTK